VIGAYGAQGEGVRGAVIDGLQSMLNQGASPEDALADAAEGSNTAIADYNARF
jgi:hypothetical protein